MKPTTRRGQLLTYGFLTLGCLSTTGPCVARFFVEFPLHHVLGWVILAQTAALFGFGCVVLIRRQLGTPAPHFHAGELVAYTAICVAGGVLLLALSPVLDP